MLHAAGSAGDPLTGVPGGHRAIDELAYALVNDISIVQQRREPGQVVAFHLARVPPVQGWCSARSFRAIARGGKAHMASRTASYGESRICSTGLAARTDVKQLHLI